MTFTCIAEPFHIWEGSNGQIMVSDERVKALRSFKDVNGAIDALFVEGYRTAARTLNNTWKQALQDRAEVEAESRIYHREAARRGHFIAAPYNRD